MIFSCFIDGLDPSISIDLGELGGKEVSEIESE